MKNALLVLVFALIASSASAQDVCPEFAHMISVINPGGKASTELDMEKAVAKQRKKGIYRGHDNSVRLESAHAKVAIAATQTFAFRPFNAQMHPGQQIKLYPFNSKKDYRELVVGGTNMWGGSKNRKSADNSIDMSFKKITDGCYRVTLGATLPKGEYAFSLGSVGLGGGADVKGTNAGYGSSTSGQVWYGFAIK